MTVVVVLVVVRDSGFTVRVGLRGLRVEEVQIQGGPSNLKLDLNPEAPKPKNLEPLKPKTVIKPKARRASPEYPPKQPSAPSTSPTTDETDAGGRGAGFLVHLSLRGVRLWG